MSCLINDDKVYLSIDIEESTRKCRRNRSQKKYLNFQIKTLQQIRSAFPIIIKQLIYVIV